MTTYRDRLIAGEHAAPGEQQTLTVSQLRAALKELGLATSGSKAELEARLAAANGS